MARRTRKNPPEREIEKESLSDRIRDLISIATLEERRTSHASQHSGRTGERRRRTDEKGSDERAE
jgi:hypothetical protein